MTFNKYKYSMKWELIVKIFNSFIGKITIALSIVSLPLSPKYFVNKFAPRENPKIAIAVFIENAGYGGTWSAPISSLMIEKYLTDSISNNWKEKRILNANLIPKHEK